MKIVDVEVYEVDIHKQFDKDMKHLVKARSSGNCRNRLKN